ncbi:hypothetical protein [Lentisalinibacter orientalis]|uniref:hypothetical protein n=1 Tax=Lentisalinibacter orientalis TaxID=2992241 RepID=UPI00386A547A
MREETPAVRAAAVPDGPSELAKPGPAAVESPTSPPGDTSNVGDESEISFAIRISRRDGSYYPFVAEHYPAATEGDPDSQFLVWRLMEMCRPHDGLLSSSSFEEVLSRLTDPSPATIERLRKTWERCSELHAHASDFSGWGRFLMDAAEGGHPYAQLEVALSRLAKGDTRETVAPLLASALGSATADVVFDMSAAAVEPDDPTSAINGAAWILAGCRLGADCGPNGYRMQQFCQFSTECGVGESVEDFVLRQFGQDTYDQATRRAEEILTHLGNDQIARLVSDWVEAG